MPFGYTNGQILEQAVTATKSLDHDVLAKYIHSHSFKTVVGELSFGKDGEWAKPRMVLTQFQNIEPNNVDQFKTGDQAADPVAAGIQDRRDDLSVRERAEEVAARRAEAAAKATASFLAMSCFVRKERIASRIEIDPRENFALTRSRRSRREVKQNTPMFPLSSRFVLENANRFPTRNRFARGNFPLSAARYFAIAGARLTAGRYCGRMSVVVALSWIGGRGSFAVPGSMMKV